MSESDDEPHLLHHEEHAAHDEPWLVSYADLMTLLFGFFVLMYSFAQAKLEKLPNETLDSFVLVRKEVARHFGGTYATPLEDAVAKLKDTVAASAPGAGLKVQLTPEGVEATFTSQALFASGSAEMADWGQSALTEFASMILSEASEYRVVVEGYTDDAPIIQAKGRYPSNWELSGARAAAVLRIFEAAGFKDDNLMAIGYGASRPEAPNRDDRGQPIPANMAINRRITIKVAVLGAVGEAHNTLLRQLKLPGQEASKP